MTPIFVIMSDDPHIKEIKKLAKLFRAAIESSNPNIRPCSFKDFPDGSCGDTSEMLGAYFIDQGLGQNVGTDIVCVLMVG